MLIEDAGVRETLRKIASRMTADPVLEEDMIQECLIHLWRLERERPGHTCSWYLQNCRFHLLHRLASGRSIDSPKRSNGERRVTLDGLHDELPADWYHTNGELLELVSARDILSTLAGRLKPRE